MRGEGEDEECWIKVGGLCTSKHGGIFFLACEDFGRMFDHSVPACTFVVEVEISSRTLIPLYRPGSVLSGSAS